MNTKPWQQRILSRNTQRSHPCENRAKRTGYRCRGRESRGNPWILLAGEHKSIRLRRLLAALPGQIIEAARSRALTARASSRRGRDTGAACALRTTASVTGVFPRWRSGRGHLIDARCLFSMPQGVVHPSCLISATDLPKLPFGRKSRRAWYRAPYPEHLFHHPALLGTKRSADRATV
jgi:hypothetical protein